MEEQLKIVFDTFRKNGGRLTEQRKKLFTIILKNPGCSCKEIYYLTKESEKKVGLATVYRNINFLREYGFIQGHNKEYNDDFLMHIE